MKNVLSGGVLGLFLASAALSLAGCSIQVGEILNVRAERHQELSAPMAPGSRLVAQTGFGSIAITGADVEGCRVQAWIHATAPTQTEADQIADQVRVLLTEEGNGLRLYVEKPPLPANRSVGVSFTIVVPRQTNLDCTTSFGPIRADDLQGTVIARTSFSDIHCEKVTGNLNLNTGHGTIECRQVSFDNLYAKTSFGNITVDCPAPSRDQTPGRADLETSYGSITAANLMVRDLEAKSSFGNVSAACTPEAPADLTATIASSYGTVSLSAPEAFAGEVNLSSSHGSVETDRPVTVQGDLGKDRLAGRIGDGDGKIHLRTSFGSIKLR